jgi:hypothetical protein
MMKRDFAILEMNDYSGSLCFKPGILPLIVLFFLLTVNGCFEFGKPTVQGLATRPSLPNKESVPFSKTVSAPLKKALSAFDWLFIPKWCLSDGWSACRRRFEQQTTAGRV